MAKATDDGRTDDRNICSCSCIFVVVVVVMGATHRTRLSRPLDESHAANTCRIWPNGVVKDKVAKGPFHYESLNVPKVITAETKASRFTDENILNGRFLCASLCPSFFDNCICSVKAFLISENSGIKL